jgi:hypothetical protein
MKASELRIGSIVANGVVVSIKLELNDYWIEFKDGSFCRLKNVEPATLTEEWLLKFGFDIQLVEIVLGKFYLKKTENYFEYYCNNRVGIRHVHQLQNLYFALTDEELKFYKK